MSLDVEEHARGPGTAELETPVTFEIKDHYPGNGGSRPSITSAQIDSELKRPRSLPWNIGCMPWFRKYFLEGQSLLSDEDPIEVFAGPTEPTFADKLLTKYRRPLSMIIPALFFHFLWWCVAIRYSLWHLFLTRYPMSITMIFGSMIAGMTSEGGGAVAFPVMTLILGVTPAVARDFSIFIQACGMMAATFSIFFMKVQIEWNSVIFSSLGGGLGLILGLEFLDPLLTPPQKKMAFVSIWFSFAFALFLLNRLRHRRTYRTIEQFNWWKGLVLVLIGCIGGIFTSFAGSGLDICSFSALTLLFRVTEKTATPTSVILMGVNSVVGTFWRIVMMADYSFTAPAVSLLANASMSTNVTTETILASASMTTNVATETYEYLAVCVPIVVIGAPLGSIIGSHFHRQVLAGLIYILDVVSLVTAYALVPQTTPLIIMSVGLIVGGGIVFAVLTKLGALLAKKVDRIILIRATKYNNQKGEVNPAYNTFANGYDS